MMSATQSKLFWPVLIVVAAVFAALLLVSAHTKATRPAIAETSNTTQLSSMATAKSETISPLQHDTKKDGPEGEIVAVQRNGFEPNQITRRAGEFLLLIDNRSGLDEIQVRLERVVNRERVHDVSLTKRAYSWNTMLNLPPGEYALTEVSHPEWTCRITLTPN
jgi:hypothetical protein